nr:MAG TPA: hypothetical protein [Caudoviricetes sp.]
MKFIRLAYMKFIDACPWTIFFLVTCSFCPPYDKFTLMSKIAFMRRPRAQALIPCYDSTP